MISSLFPSGACLPSSSRVKHGSGPNPVTPTFMPFGRYADVGPHKIKSSHPGLQLHVGSTTTLYIKKGTLLGTDITYLSQVWNVWDADSMQAFYEQVMPYIHPETLRPLMGICAPTVICLYNAAAGRLSLAMELPHPIGWREADPNISAELKEKVIAAYQNIHSRSILHNDAKLENVLIGDDDKVTIVDFCKMVVDPDPADLALEMRVVKFMLDYDGAKEIEYERLRKAESRVKRNLWRSRFRRAAKSQELADELEPDQPPPQEEIDFPPFCRRSLMKWDSEVITEGTTHCPGWRGKRFEVPEDMRNPLWAGIKDYTPPTPLPYQPINFASLVETAFGGKPFRSHSQWMKHCRYFPCLWASLPESTVSGLKRSVETLSSTTSSGSLDYGSCSEQSSTTDSEPSKKDRSPTPSFTRKRLRTKDFTRPNDYTGDEHGARGPKLSETLVEYGVDQASWTIYRVGELGPPSPFSKSKGKEREPPPSVTPPWETFPWEAEPSTLASLSPNPRKFAGGPTRRSTANSYRRRASASTDSGRSSPSRVSPPTGRTTSPRDCHPRPKSERKCSVVVKDGGEEDKIWFMSREVLQDVKGYLQVKKAAGAAIEVLHSGGEGGPIRNSPLRVERILRSPSTQPTRKRTSSPEDDNEETQKPKRRRSWPEIDPYVSKIRTGSLQCSG